MSRLAGLLALSLLLATQAVARTLLVGEGRDYRMPSEALAAARDGDTVSIAPGEYFDCAIVRANDLVIQGEGDGPSAARPAALTDKACEDKAILVLRGNGTTVRNLTLQRVRVPDGNGAGIRLENQNLAVEHVHFKNDQVGILSGITGGDVTVTDSLFTAGGVGGTPPKYALMIGRSTRLRVTGCTFSGVKGGQIATEAERSEIAGNRIDLGAGDLEEPPAYAVLATGGALLVERNAITVGPLMPLPEAAVGVWDGATALLRDNHLDNRTGRAMTFLKDWSWSSPVLQDNAIGSGDRLSTSSGIWRHRASNQYYLRKEEARAFASQAKQMVKHLLGR